MNTNVKPLNKIKNGKKDFQILGNGTETQVIESATDIMNEYINNLSPRERKVMQLTTTSYISKYNEKGEIIDQLERDHTKFKSKSEFLACLGNFEGFINGISEGFLISRNIEKYEDGYVVSYIVLLGETVDGEKVTDYTEYMVSGDFD